MRALPLLMLVLAPLSGTAQTWWNEANNWDGVTHWSRYITFSPYYMGANALPVPSVTEGNYESVTRLSLGGEAHFSEGDATQDAITALHLPITGGRVALRMDWMAVEHFATDTIVRDMRAARDRDGEGFSTGDVYISTLVQLLPERERVPGVLLRLRLRTASGSNLASARHTDAPGYSFDLSIGKWMAGRGGWLKRWRPHAMAGFLVYQTNRIDYFQNDCLLFGAGVIGDHGAWRSSLQVAGYLGYIGFNDRPIVLRASLTANADRRVEHRIGLQGPLQDWRYTSFGYTLGLRLGGPIPLPATSDGN